MIFGKKAEETVYGIAYQGFEFNLYELVMVAFLCGMK